VILPARNEKDLDEIDTTIRNQLEFFPVQNIDEVFEISLNQKSVARVKKAQKKKQKSAPPRANSSSNPKPDTL
ncbi:MAG: S16 family serine protease, partial [bacterium]|jgi:ATP-dependent Lon protease|nr:S16 family serine protease [bacterium]